ncbi:MAG: hypothetical protein ONB05_01675 [candidate division KSB1 bacterium]|nr:hypothetical protein [candidate division KSB1 bacterium]
MHVDEIRKLTQPRAFKMFEIHIENGGKYFIKHPENVFITSQLIITVDEQGRTIFIAPEAVSTIAIVDGYE